MTELLQEHVVAAMIKQARLREAVGDDPQGFAVDVPGRWLQVGRREFAADLIGTEANATFVWAPGIADLVGDFEMPADRVDAFTASVLTVGIAGLDAYYLAPYEEQGDAILALGIRDPGLRVGAPSAMTVVSTLTSLLEQAPPFSHRRAFAYYLARPLPTVPAEIVDGRIVLSVPEGVVRVSFDGEGRVGEFRAELGGSA